MNPYEVLGVSENATDEEIKKAYKELVKKYHPDKYHNNPLADLAEEKLQEINEAYDMLMKGRGGKGASGSTGRGGTPDYMQIRRYLDAGNLSAAETMLNGTNDRSAEWFFLSGMLSYKKGWYDDAINKIRTAADMEPGNVEYSRAYGTRIRPTDAATAIMMICAARHCSATSVLTAAATVFKKLQGRQLANIPRKGTL